MAFRGGACDRLGTTELAVWLMKQGIQLHWSGIRHPQTQGKVERFHGEMERASQHRGWQGKPQQQWLDEFRWEHNQVRPHEALDMRTPASVWHPSPRSYDAQPPRWEYPAGARVRRLDANGKINAFGRTWNIGQGLAGSGYNCCNWKIGCRCITAAPWCANSTRDPVFDLGRTLDRRLSAKLNWKGCVETNWKVCLGTRYFSLVRRAHIHL